MSRVTVQIPTPDMCVIATAAKMFGFKDPKAFIAEVSVQMARFSLLTSKPLPGLGDVKNRNASLKIQRPKSP